MSDFSQAANIVEVVGRTGSGKTTFVYRYLVNVATQQKLNPDPPACIFIYDWKHEAETRLGVPAVTTLAGCEHALASRLVIYNPDHMFDGTAYITPPEGGRKVSNDYKLGCRWFCEWVFEVCKRGPGRKVFYLDEMREFQSAHFLPNEIGRLFRIGRSEGLEMITSTQYPRDYHADVRGAVTEWVLFSCTEPGEIEAVERYYPGASVMATLPRGSFVAYSREYQTTLRGKLF